MGVNKTQEALKLALKTLEKMGRVMKQSPDTEKAIVAIRKALAEHIEQHLEMVEQSTCKQALQVEQPAQQQEPVAVARVDDLERGGRVRALAMGLGLDAALYTSPQPAQPSKPLTDEEILDMARTFGAQPWPPGSCVAFARAIEAKLKENT